MKRLASRKGLASRFGVEFVDESWPYLEVKSWPGVVRVVGEAKRESTGRVFVRGQTENYRAMRPRLFRGATTDDESLVVAAGEFASKLGNRVNVGRFKVPDVGSLLQHYGFKTNWLDVLDNLFVAYWFAAHKVSEETNGAIRIGNSGKTSGWLFLLRPPPLATVVDLRVSHHPLSSRPHVQHGISLACAHGTKADFQDWVVATIQTPVSECVSGSLFTGPALFPPRASDHTLRLLLKHKANELAARVESSHQLPERSLGRISHWQDATVTSASNNTVS